MTPTEIGQAIGDLRALAVKRLGPNAWNLSPPLAPWRRRSADLEREALLEWMIAKGSVGAFWMDELHREWLSDGIAIVHPVSGKASEWLFVQGKAVQQAVEDLYIGAWSLFLLEGMPDEPPSHPDGLATDGTISSEALEKIGAYACVHSWEDDLEWTISVLLHASEPRPGTLGVRRQRGAGGSSVSSS